MQRRQFKNSFSLFRWCENKFASFRNLNKEAVFRKLVFPIFNKNSVFMKNEIGRDFSHVFTF